MAEDNGQGSSGANANAGGEGSADDQSLNAASYPKDFVEKLKKEKMNARAEADRLKAEIAAKESSELEKAGKLNELVELERNRAKGLEEKNKLLSDSIVQKAVLSAAREEAKKAGAQYFEVIEKMLDTSKIEVNADTLEVDYSGIKNQIAGIKSRMPGLFVAVAAPTNDLPPGGAGQRIPQKSLDQMSQTELKELLRTKI